MDKRRKVGFSRRSLRISRKRSKISGYARAIGLGSWKEWKAFCRSDKRPDDIPSHPDLAYKQFAGTEDWLGYVRTYKPRKKWMPLGKFKKWELVFQEYKEYCGVQNTNEAP